MGPAPSSDPVARLPTPPGTASLTVLSGPSLKTQLGPGGAVLGDLTRVTKMCVCRYSMRASSQFRLRGKRWMKIDRCMIDR